MHACGASAPTPAHRNVNPQIEGLSGPTTAVADASSRQPSREPASQPPSSTPLHQGHRRHSGGRPIGPAAADPFCGGSVALTGGSRSKTLSTRAACGIAAGSRALRLFSRLGKGQPARLPRQSVLLRAMQTDQHDSYLPTATSRPYSRNWKQHLHSAGSSPVALLRTPHAPRLLSSHSSGGATATATSGPAAIPDLPSGSSTPQEEHAPPFDKPPDNSSQQSAASGSPATRQRSSALSTLPFSWELIEPEVLKRRSASDRPQPRQQQQSLPSGGEPATGRPAAGSGESSSGNGRSGEEGAPTPPAVRRPLRKAQGSGGLEALGELGGCLHGRSALGEICSWYACISAEAGNGLGECEGKRICHGACSECSGELVW